MAIAQSTSANALSDQVVARRSLLGFAGMVLGQFMAILDIQIVASSLPQIQVGIGASADEISWAQTAYLMGEIVMIPLSGYLSRLWGLQKTFLLSCLGFTIMSLAVGLSSNVEAMIFTRAVQGFVGGAMIPIVLSAVFITFPLERRMTASTVVALIVTLAPTLGPSLGGHVTEWLNWRWLFFINLAPGVLAMSLVGAFGNFDKGDPSLGRMFDWWGLSLMAICLSAFVYILEEGTRLGWLESDQILLLSVISCVSGVFFLVRMLSYSHPVVDLRALTNPTLAAGIFVSGISGAALFGGTFLLPVFLGRVLHYSSSQVGTAMLVTGLAMLVAGAVVGPLARRLDARIPMFLGFAMVAYGFWYGRVATDDWGFWQFAILQTWRGCGLVIATAALQRATMGNLPPAMIKNASALFNLSRTLGGALAIAALATMVVRRTAVHTAELSTSAGLTNGAAQALLSTMTANASMTGAADPASVARKMMSNMLVEKAQVLAFNESFVVIAVLCLLCMGASLMFFNRIPSPSQR